MAEQGGVQMFLAHFPDFYGLKVGSTLIHHTLNDILANKKSLSFSNL